MARDGERQRLAVLLVILAVVIGYAAVRFLGQPGGGGESEAVSGLTYTPQPLPRLETAQRRAGDVDTSRRNPFLFGLPPTPTPNLTPRPTLPPRPTPTPRPTATPTPPGYRGPPPDFDWEYAGYFGPDRLPVAVFRKDEDLEVAVPGDVFKETFIIREIGMESVLIGFVGYPEEESTRVPLAEQ